MAITFEQWFKEQYGSIPNNAQGIRKYKRLQAAKKELEEAQKDYDVYLTQEIIMSAALRGWKARGLSNDK